MSRKSYVSQLISIVDSYTCLSVNFSKLAYAM